MNINNSVSTIDCIIRNSNICNEKDLKHDILQVFKDYYKYLYLLIGTFYFRKVIFTKYI
jgi:hypothetical protein